ncbi:phosphatidylethanolamine-binding protein [Hyaloraphidium curvatum]|nr:phosphatidylethanolamine-binding protein [Hyaloraphidium curvatum]
MIHRRHASNFCSAMSAILALLVIAMSLASNVRGEGFREHRAKQLEAAGIIPDVIPYGAMDRVDLRYKLSIKLANGDYAGDGNRVQREDGHDMPHFSWTLAQPDYGSPDEDQKRFTLAFVDPDAPRRNPNPPSTPVPQWRHLVLSNLHRSSSSHHSAELTPWAPPTPPKGTGAHRYVAVLLEGTAEEAIPGGRGRWDVWGWAEGQGMGVVGVDWFVVEG